MNTLFSVVICDDDPDFVDDLNKKVIDITKKLNVQCEISLLYNGKELIEHCRKNISDIVLVDIDMPDIDGFKAVQTLRQQQSDLAVIFITAHEEYAFQAYNYQPFWFVSKNDLSMLEDVLIKLFRKIEYRKTVQEIVYIRSDKLIAINTEQVMYITSSGHYLIPHTSHGEESSSRCGIQQAYASLKGFGFICAHRSCIVNCRYIDKFTQQSITLKNGIELPVSRNKDIVDEATELYKQFLRRLRW